MDHLINHMHGKNMQERWDLQRRVINYRNTPHPSTGKAPNQLIMGRLLNTKIPSTTSLSSNRRLPSRHLLTLSPTRLQGWKARRSQHHKEIDLNSETKRKKSVSSSKNDQSTWHRGRIQGAERKHITTFQHTTIILSWTFRWIERETM